MITSINSKNAASKTSGQESPQAQMIQSILLQCLMQMLGMNRSKSPLVSPTSSAPTSLPSTGTYSNAGAVSGDVGVGMNADYSA